MWKFQSNQCRVASLPRKKALIICTHLHPGRMKPSSKAFLQPLSGLHVASLIDSHRFEVTLYHEDWHGPYVPSREGKPDIVFLTGLQADFDRMRQLSFYFRRNGTAVVAGGSICTLFPQFAAQFFDSVCVGAVDVVPSIVADFEHRRLKPIYHSPSHAMSNYEVDYSLFKRSGINPLCHLVEASRGCNFRCSFCVIPAEGVSHTSYDLETLRRAIDRAIETSPLMSFRRWYPTVFFLDNNFASDRQSVLRVSHMLRKHRRIRAWGALVTRDVLHDRDFILQLAKSKCRILFIGLESLDREFLRFYNKKQNLSRRGNIFDDIEYAERQGICVNYGYLFDPSLSTIAEMQDQINVLTHKGRLSIPIFFSLVIPLAGTATFWTAAEQGLLAPNLRLRDLDGETIAYAHLQDARHAVADFVERFRRRPWTLISWQKVLVSTLSRIWNSRRFDPMHWCMIAATNFYQYIWAFRSLSNRKSYFAGEDVLDPQYLEYPIDISSEDYATYFRPIELTDSDGRLQEWLLPYVRGTRQRSLPLARF